MRRKCVQLLCCLLELSSVLQALGPELMTEGHLSLKERSVQWKRKLEELERMRVSGLCCLLLCRS